MSGKENFWKASVLTLYPDMFPGPLGASLAGRGLEENIWSLDVTHLREFGLGKHKDVDDTPAGGGPGMVLRADVVGAAIEQTISADDKRPIIALSARGKPLDQKKVRALSQGSGVILLCGRFEGFDERIFEEYDIEEVSIGDFVLQGGEVAAFCLLEACIRLLPGIMGSEVSGEMESFEHGLLEYPQYTRPRDWKNREIPEVLQSGDHGKIAKWRLEKAERLTQEKRPDMWQDYEKTNKKDP